MLSGVVLLVSYIVTASKYRNREALKNPIFLLQAAFLFLIGFSTLVSWDRGVTFDLFQANCKLFIPFLVMVRIVDSDSRLNRVITIFSLCAVLMALHTIYNYFILGETYTILSRGFGIESGIFADPNDLALLFNACLPYLLFATIKAKQKFLPLAGVIAVITAVMLTQSRGGFLGLCAVGLGFLMFIAKTHKGYIPLIVTISILFWLLASDIYKERISSITDWEADEQTGLTGTRLDAWKVVFNAALENPVFGVGAGCSLYLAGSEMSDWHQVHNSFLQIFSELGLIGFVIYLLLYLLPYRQLIKMTRVELPELFLTRSKIIIVSLLSYAVTALFLPQGYSPIFYTLTGIALIQVELSKRRDELADSYSCENNTADPKLRRHKAVVP